MTAADGSFLLPISVLILSLLRGRKCTKLPNSTKSRNAWLQSYRNSSNFQGSSTEDDFVAAFSKKSVDKNVPQIKCVVMLCGWEENSLPGNSNGSLTPGF